MSTRTQPHVETAKPAEGLSGRWAQAISLLGEDMRRRDSAERTRHAYGTDLRQFADWAN